MDLRSITACVTGAASGLGLSTALQLARAGAHVAMLDLQSQALETAIGTIQNQVPNSKYLGAFAADVSDTEQIQEALREIKAQLGTPQILVNCAGILLAKRAVGKQGPMPLEDFERVIRVNLIGTFNTIRLFVEQMENQNPNLDGERGVIINTASIAAFEGQIGQAAYSASKSGIVGMTLPLAREFAALGIRVMAIAPGIMETPMLGALSEQAQTALQSSALFPKRLGKPEEFAMLVKHIIENPLLNGTVIRLDGGIRLSV